MTLYLAKVAWRDGENLGALGAYGNGILQLYNLPL
jgi:hypothetical protein